VVLNEDSKTYLETKGIKNVHKIPNFFAIEGQPKTSELQNKVIAFAATWNPICKGVDYLFEIAKHLPTGWKIAIAGMDQTNVELNELYQKANLHNRLTGEGVLDDKIDFRGMLNHQELLNLYQSSSIFLMTSREEGFPLVALEAMSCGLPVVAFENAALKEVTENGKYGVLVEMANIAEITKQITKLTESYELRQQWSEKSLERSTHFSKERIFKMWREILE
jgi:glycosyltransferase involved in cell wall biosynthesis